MDFSNLFNDALSAALKDINSGRFALQSEKDLQSIIFHHALLLVDESVHQIGIHAEPTKAGLRPDLVFGQDEVFVEIKLSKSGIGGYTQALESWKSDVKKLKAYKEKWPDARCVFLAIDESGYHSDPLKQNFFDPVVNQLQGNWQKFINNKRILIADA